MARLFLLALLVFWCMGMAVVWLTTGHDGESIIGFAILAAPPTLTLFGLLVFCKKLLRWS